MILKRLWQTAGLAVLLTIAAPAATIQLFYDSAFVDINPEDNGSEASNVRAFLDNNGFTYGTFQGVTTSEWTTALTGAGLVIFPEFEFQDPFSSLDPGAQEAFTNYLNSGGSALFFFNLGSFLQNYLPTAGDAGDQGSWDINPEAPAPWAGGPAVFNSQNATTSLDISQVSGAVSIYGDLTASVLFYAPYGNGRIYFYGWDFYRGSLDSDPECEIECEPPPCLECPFELSVASLSFGPVPPFSGLAGGEDEILYRTLQTAVPETSDVPEPSTWALLGTGLVAVVLRARRK